MFQNNNKARRLQQILSLPPTYVNKSNRLGQGDEKVRFQNNKRLTIGYVLRHTVWDIVYKSSPGSKGILGLGFKIISYS
jgi:hypothetical protein